MDLLFREVMVAVAGMGMVEDGVGVVGAVEAVDLGEGMGIMVEGEAVVAGGVVVVVVVVEGAAEVVVVAVVERATSAGRWGIWLETASRAVAAEAEAVAEAEVGAIHVGKRGIWLVIATRTAVVAEVEGDMAVAVVAAPAAVVVVVASTVGNLGILLGNALGETKVG